MSRLVAHFKVELPGRCLVAWPDEDEIVLGCSHKQFDVRITLIRNQSSGAMRSGDLYMTRSLYAANVEVSKEETDTPPPVIPDEKGIRDYSVQSKYFEERIKLYGGAASESINRLIRFFKYNLNTPSLAELDSTDQSFRNAKWTDADGTEVGKGTQTFISQPLPGIWGDLGVKKLTPELAPFLQDALNKPFVPTLFQEIQADARTALFEKQLRRAVLELAIACEILVKRAFFSEDTPSGAAFDYLEDKSKVTVRIIDLIDSVAKEAFGRSFREDHPVHFHNVDYLYRCRNKVAHRGSLSFRDNAGIQHTVDETAVKVWWESVEQLRIWLSVQKLT